MKKYDFEPFTTTRRQPKNVSSQRNCWRRKTTLEKVLIVTTTLLSVLVLAFILAGMILHQPPVCTKTTCIRAAAAIVDFIDQTVDPCEDFYRFACGTFIKNREEERPTPFDDLEHRIRYQKRQIIVEDIVDDDSNSLKQMKRYYRACLNLTAIDEDDLTFMEVIEELGGWPVLKINDWKEDQFQWYMFLVQTNVLGLGYFAAFLTLDVYQNYNDTEINYPELVVPNVNEIIDEKEYLQLMIDVVSDFGIAENFGTFEMKNVLKFELELNRLITENNKWEESRLVRIDELKYFRLNWKEFLNNLTMGAKKFDGKDEIIVPSDEYLRNLDALIRKTPKRVVANYCIWTLITEYAPFLTSSIRDKFEDYQNDDTYENREDFCLDQAEINFPGIQSVAYVKRSISPKMKADLKEMIENIRKELLEILSKNTWMDQHTKSVAIKKAETIDYLIGAPDEMFDDHIFDQYQGLVGFNFSDDNFITMNREKSLQSKKHLYSSIYANSTDHAETLIEITMKLNAFFSIAGNAMTLPAPILQGIFYDVKRPAYLNYGAIGKIIGHEFTHAFDINAQHRGEDGEEIEFYTNNSAAAFLEKAQCYIESYEHYEQNLGKDLNGTVTFEENLADFFGIDLAYNGYKRWKKDHGMEYKLPGLKYTPNQLYWIQSNLLFCFKKIPGIEGHWEEPEEHSIPSFRVNGALRNSKFFAKDFLCKPNTKMNPKQKCQMF